MEKEVIEKKVGEILRALPIQDANPRTQRWEKITQELGIAFLGRRKLKWQH